MSELGNLTDFGFTIHLLNIPIAFVLISTIGVYRFTNSGSVCSGDNNDFYAEQYFEMTGIKTEPQDFSHIYMLTEGTFLKYVAFIYAIICAALFNIRGLTNLADKVFSWWAGMKSRSGQTVIDPCEKKCETPKESAEPNSFEQPD